MAEYIRSELALNAAEVSSARWLTVDEICHLDGTFEGDREFIANPSLSRFSKVISHLSLPLRAL